MYSKITKTFKTNRENNYKEVDVRSMPFEKVALYRKYLLFENEIPDELKESVIEALKIVDFDQKEKQEEPLLCLIGFIRSCGAIDLMVVQRQAQSMAWILEVWKPIHYLISGHTIHLII